MEEILEVEKCDCCGCLIEEEVEEEEIPDYEFLEELAWK